MANITGSGSLTIEELEVNHDLCKKYKDVTGSGSLEVEELTQGLGTGLKYADGEIASHPTHLITEVVVVSGTGKADNLVGIPRATCEPIKAKFHICNTIIQARFKL